MGHLATWQCNRTLLADEHTEFADKHIFLTGESEPTGSWDNESDGEDSDEDSNYSEGNDGADIDNLNDTDLVDVAGFAAL